MYAVMHEGKKMVVKMLTFDLEPSSIAFYAGSCRIKITEVQTDVEVERQGSSLSLSIILHTMLRRSFEQSQL